MSPDCVKDRIAAMSWILHAKDKESLEFVGKQIAADVKDGAEYTKDARFMDGLRTNYTMKMEVLSQR